MSEILRTPEARFEALPGYPFAPHYLDELPGFAGVRVHYVDEPPAAADDHEEGAAAGAAARWRRPRAVLCLHGQPTWSYLYRRMIPILAGEGYRVVAPDLPGFGKSDKPVEEGPFSLPSLRAAVIGLIEALDLRDLVVIGHDWGAVIAASLPLALAERISGLVLMNTTLPTGDRRLPDGVVGWRTFNAANPDLNIPGLMAKANRILNVGECRAYGAPFPDTRHKAAVRALPALMSDDFNAPGGALMRAARAFLAEAWEGASQLVVGLRDPVHGHTAMRRLHRDIRNGPEPILLEHAGHFVPEWGDEFCDLAMRSIEAQIDERRAEALAAAAGEGAAA